MSNLFRNVPFLTSLEVSPFPVLLLSGSLALPGAQPCGARRAERLGRSAGQGQRRARRGRRLSGRFLLCPATGRLAPRVIRRRHPLPFYGRDRNTRFRSLGGSAARTCGLVGAGISCHRSARPWYSMAILPYRPSHTNTLPCPGAWWRLCGCSWENRLSYRTTQSSLIVRSLSNRKIRSISVARGARR